MSKNNVLYDLIYQSLLPFPEKLQLIVCYCHHVGYHPHCSADTRILTKMRTHKVLNPVIQSVWGVHRISSPGGIVDRALVENGYWFIWSLKEHIFF